MISSKILVQSATAGLMAGAILAAPMFVFGPDDASFSSSRAESGAQQQAYMKRSTVHFQPPVLRAAPQPARTTVRRDKHKHRRTLEERNRAASQALQQIDKAYEHTTAQRRGARAAHSVRLNSTAKQAAARVHIFSNFAAKCRAENRQVCNDLQALLRQHAAGPADQR